MDMGDYVAQLRAAHNRAVTARVNVTAWRNIVEPLLVNVRTAEYEMWREAEKEDVDAADDFEQLLSALD